jgi:putative phosphoribosyl transferase
MPFSDRRSAGRRLAERLMSLEREDVVVLGLPRGGVPVAFEVARALAAPLDVIVVRKLGVPFQPELGMGAIGEGGVRVLNDAVLGAAGVSSAEIAEVERRERNELDRRARVYRGDRPRVNLARRTAVVIDDGIATGSTARAACQVAIAQGAARVVLAVPVAAASTVAELRREVEVVCVETPEDLWAIGQWYADFSQTSDEEVRRLLDESAALTSVSAPPDQPGNTPIRDEEVEVRAAGVLLAGHLTVPEQPAGMVVFAHGSGSSRHSPRNQFVAQVLNRAGLGTLLFDLLTRSEELDRANVFDVELLAGRLAAVSGWLRDQPVTGYLPIGYFGASTGAAAALWAASDPAAEVEAVVSRGGRPDLAGPRLTRVRAPTLLIVGALDYGVIELNRHAHALLRCEKRLAVVPGATHLFEEPGTLAAAADLAQQWLSAHLVRPRLATGSA